MSELLKLRPVFKDYLWGGTELKKEFCVDDLSIVAEAWMLSTHPDGQSMVVGGKYDGKTLCEALSLMDGALGKNCEKFENFPQLIKLIDAADRLSVQVHPSDDYALEHEKQYGKTEMWYILNAEKGAGIYYGLKSDITKEEFERHIKENTLTDALNFIEVKKGESYFIPAGTIHAIGKGLLIAEIQQNSNATYRIFDYGRTDKFGNQRELHIEKAKAVSVLSVSDVSGIIKADNLLERTLVSSKYFTVSEINVCDTFTHYTADSFACVIVLDGNGTLNDFTTKKYDTFFIPADVTANFSGTMKLLVSYVK